LGLKDSTWLTPAGSEMTEENWHDGNARCLGLLLDGRVPVSGIRRRGSEATLLLVVNAHHDVVVFMLPEVKGGRVWERLVDTNLPDADEDPEDRVRFEMGHRYEVTGRSLLLFLLRPARAGRE
jgi:glycogen operon protein